MITYKMGHRRRRRSILCYSNDATKCHPSACDGEEPRHVIRCSRCASKYIYWLTLCYVLEPLIPTSNVAPIDLTPVSPFYTPDFYEYDTLL